MKIGMTCLVALACVAFVSEARAYEYPLQFTPNPGYRGLVVAGYAFDGDNVVGNCSYYTVHSGSGRGGGYRIYKTYYDQTCTWDQYGNLLGITPGAPVVPAPLFVNGTQTVYAENANGDLTGSDTALGPNGGFVITPGSHYSWVTPNTYTNLTQKFYVFPITLVSDGETPLNITSVESTTLTGRSRVLATGTTCAGVIPVGSTCVINVFYNPWLLCSTTGLAYDTLDVNVTSDAGQASDFVQSYTITLRSATGCNN